MVKNNFYFGMAEVQPKFKPFQSLLPFQSRLDQEILMKFVDLSIFDLNSNQITFNQDESKASLLGVKRGRGGGGR